MEGSEKEEKEEEEEEEEKEEVGERSVRIVSASRCVTLPTDRGHFIFSR